MKNYKVLLLTASGCDDSTKFAEKARTACEEAGVRLDRHAITTIGGRAAAAHHGITETPAMVKLQFGERFGEVLYGVKLLPNGDTQVARKDTILNWVNECPPEDTSDAPGEPD